MRQLRASRDKATRTSQNKNDKEMFIQRSSSRNKSTFSSQNADDSEGCAKEGHQEMKLLVILKCR